MELGANNLGAGLSGGAAGSRTSGSADDYYKSLLARVDNAIVETKSGEGAADGARGVGGSAKANCAGCLGWCKRLGLWIVGTMTLRFNPRRAAR